MFRFSFGVMGYGGTRLEDIERALTEAGVPFKRDFEWSAGWTFEVGGELVARGAAIGILESELRVWWKRYTAEATSTGAFGETCS